MSTRLFPDKTLFSSPTNLHMMSASEKQPVINDEYYNTVCQPFYPNNNLDDALTSHPSQMPIGLHAQSHTLPSATASSLPNITAMDATDYRNAGDYVLYQDTANYPVFCHQPGSIHTINEQSNIPSYEQVDHMNSYPVSVPSLGFPAENNHLSDHAINQASISYIITQMPIKTLLSSDNSNEFTNPGYVVTKVECTHLGMISAADIEKFISN